MESRSFAAAWRRVERSAPARSVQWCSPTRDPLKRLAPTIASAVTTAASQLEAVVSGDQPTRSTPRGQATSPLGSYRNAQPSRLREGAVARMTSGLVEVETTGPSDSKILGMTREDVFPDRGGPNTRVERSAPAHIHPCAPVPT